MEHHVTRSSQRDYNDYNVTVVEDDDEGSTDDEPDDAEILSRRTCSPKVCKFCRRQEHNDGLIKQIETGYY